jgi:hypothetical protein
VVDQNGVINAYAGAGGGFGGDGGPALQAGVNPSGMAFSSDGTLFFIDGNRVRKSRRRKSPSPDRAMSRSVAMAVRPPAQPETHRGRCRGATQASAGTNRVRRVSTDGIITTFTGNGAAAPSLMAPRPQTTIATANGLAVGSTLYIADAGHAFVA